MSLSIDAGGTGFHDKRGTFVAIDFDKVVRMSKKEIPDQQYFVLEIRYHGGGVDNYLVSHAQGNIVLGEWQAWFRRRRE